MMNLATHPLPLFARFTRLSLAAALLLGSAQALQAQCATAPGLATVTGNVSYGDPINWANPNRAVNSDDLFARVTLDAGNTSKYLLTADYGFVIPAAAVIEGIEVTVERRMDANAAIMDASARLLKGGAPTGNEAAQPGLWTSSDLVTVYGGPTDLWGAAWTPADIMSEDFGFVLSAQQTGAVNNVQAHVDNITMTIYFNTSGSCILPATLGGFYAAGDPGNVHLYWNTVNEMSTASFTLERSTDGQNFQPVTQVTAAGNSRERVHYEATDTQPLRGDALYRLVQTDLDGATHILGTTTWRNGSTPAVQASLSPNPASSQVHLEALLPSGNGSFTLRDLQGRTWIHENLEHGLASHDLDLSSLPRGLYLLELRDAAGSSTTQKLILQ